MLQLRPNCECCDVDLPSTERIHNPNLLAGKAGR
jgi:hypothetical protein